LPRAGIFQTGTRAVVDETLARLALAHGSFLVQPLANAAPLVAVATDEAARPRTNPRKAAGLRAPAAPSEPR